MHARFRTLYHALCGALVAQGVLIDEASAIGPSDCKAGHADSTCAAGVVGAPVPIPAPPPPGPPPPPPSPPPGPPPVPDLTVIYDGPIAGLPSGGIAYWGFDFLSDSLGIPSPMFRDVYINRSAYPLTLRFTFTTPLNKPCGTGCLPRLEFRMGPAWALRYAPFTVSDGVAIAEYEIPANYYYAWVIGLQDTTNPILRVTTDRHVTLDDAGLPTHMNAAAPIPPKIQSCSCQDGSIAECSYGTRYSSGLMGHWDNDGYYYSDDGWNFCPTRDGS
jgi:hypothetical protein